MATMTLEELTRQLTQAYGDALVAVVLYGSGASGETIAKHSNLNVLVIVRDLSMDRLRAASAVAHAWNAAGNPAPLTLTEREWRSSCDIFPMEYADILERHRVLHGALPTDGVRVDRAHLRLQVEYEAMGKLLALRQGTLAAAGDERRQLEVLQASLSPILVVFRALLRLHGDRPPTGHEALVNEAARLGAFEPEPFLRVVRHVRGDERLKGAAVGETLSRYLAAMEELVRHLDRFAPPA
jgi:hypothetical protein